MRPSFRKLMGGFFATGCVVACSVYLAATPKVMATPTSDPVWKAFELKDVFLHDLTSGQATFVTAMVLAEDGSVTADIAELSKVKFAPKGSPVAAAKSEAALDMETQLDRQVVVNATENKIVAYFHNESGLQEIYLLPGEGVAIGELPDTAVQRFRWGCKCVCDHGGTILQTAIMYCEDVFQNHPAGAPCDCISLVTTPCWFRNEEGVLLEGQMNGCKSGLLPVM